MRSCNVQELQGVEKSVYGGELLNHSSVALHTITMVLRKRFSLTINLQFSLRKLPFKKVDGEPVAKRHHEVSGSLVLPL